MIPTLFTDVPGEPLLVLMSGSVGRAGMNDMNDARLIQTLLARVPVAWGGPLAPLVVDGRVGPRTISAISRFQHHRLGLSDGLVEPNRRTVRALVPIIRKKGGLPPNLHGISTPDPKLALAIHAQESAPDLVFGSTFMADSGWEFTGSAGISLSHKWAGITAGFMTIKHVSQPTVVYKLHFGGVTLGVSTSQLPFSLSGSLPSFKSFGTRIRHGLWGKPPLRVADFVGPCTVFTLEGNVTGAGWTGAVVTFGPAGFWIAAGALTGAQLATAKGVGASMCIGAVAAWS